VTDPSLKGAGGASAANGSRAIKMTNKLHTGNAVMGRSPLDLLKEQLQAASSPRGSAAAAGVRASGGATTPANRDKGVAVAEESAQIVRTLRAQLEAANKACSAKEEECRRLTSAVAARDQEITRSSKYISGAGGSKGSGSAVSPKAGGDLGFGTAGVASAGGDSYLTQTKAEQFLAADTANKRIIDQLNSQVDFLNKELARREAQLVENSEKMMQFETLRMELAHRNGLLEQARRDVGQSATRIRALEQKVGGCVNYF
jgi:DNA repair exonuclease SbcCD ATPase subunit